MDELLKQFLVNAPYAAIFLYMLAKVYQDWKADRAASDAARTEQTKLLAEISERLDSIDKSISGNTRLM